MTAPSGDTVVSPEAAIAGDPSTEGLSTEGPSAEGHSLERNSLALTVSALLTGVVGLVYWAILGRLYPAREVGAAAAVITTATMLSAFGNFGIGGLFERFLPLAGQRSKSLVGAGFAVGAVGGLLLGGGFLLLGPTSEMFLHPFEYWLFPVVVVVFSTFAMLDHTAVAFREAGWAAGKNVAHAIVKLVLAAALAFTASHLAIIWTWTVPALIAALVLGVMVARRLLHARLSERGVAVATSAGDRELPGRFLRHLRGQCACATAAPADRRIANGCRRQRVLCNLLVPGHRRTGLDDHAAGAVRCRVGK